MQYVNELKNISPNNLNDKLSEYYNTLSNKTFFSIIKNYYQNLDKDAFIQKLIELYRKYPADILLETINNTYIKLPNVVKINNKKYKLNSIVSKIKSDTKFFRHTSTNPSSIDLRNDLLGIRDQGPYGISTCFAIAGMKEFQEIKEKLYTKYLSPSSIYILRENQESPFMSLQNGLEILKTKGITFEINTNEKFKIKDYEYVDRINDLKLAINKNGPCVIHFPCYNGGRFFWKKNSINDKLLGGHCALAVGYDATRGFLIRNSWGEDWGEFGYTWFPYEDWGLQNEIWTSINSLVINNINTAPIIPVTAFPPIKAISIANSSSLLSPIQQENFFIKYEINKIAANYFTKRNILIIIILLLVVFIFVKNQI
jgi:hypothetical protein